MLLFCGHALTLRHMHLFHNALIVFEGVTFVGYLSARLHIHHRHPNVYAFAMHAGVV